MFAKQPALKHIIPDADSLNGKIQRFNDGRSIRGLPTAHCVMD